VSEDSARDDDEVIVATEVQIGFGILWGSTLGHILLASSGLEQKCNPNYNWHKVEQHGNCVGFLP
jgi:hypothetical protein